METCSRFFSSLTGNQRPKAQSDNSQRSIGIQDIERSDSAESQEMAQAGHVKTAERVKAPPLKRRDELQKLQQPSNKLSPFHGHQQLDKREVAVTKKVNTELEDALKKKSEDLRTVQERYSNLLRDHKVLKHNVEELALAKKTAVDLKEKLREMEARFRTHQKEVTTLQTALKTQKDELDNMMKLKRTAEQKLKQLHSELEITRGQLRLCKDDLFRLQPMAQVPDTEIVKDYDSICQDVICWIDMEVSTFEKTHPKAELSDIFSGGAIPEAISMLDQFSTSGEYWVRFVVHYCLHNFLFSRSVYLLGLPKEIKQCLQAAEDRMAKLEPPRDLKTINAWRSETLTAIAATQVFAANRNAEIDDIGRKVFLSVGQYFPIIHLQAQSEQRLLDEVVLPAAKLASKIQVAASTYEFYVQKYPFRKYDPITIDDHEVMKMVDVKTRKTIKGSSATIQDGERRIGEIVIPLEPSLWRINENAESTMLRPEVNLIKLDQPLAKRVKPSA